MGKGFQWIQEKAKELAAYAGTLKNGKDTVLSLLKTYAEANEHLSRLYTYASCNLNVDNGDSFQQGVMARAQSLYAQYSAAVAFLSPELLKLPKATLKGYIADPDFADFDTILKDLERMRPHTLSSEVETLLASGQEVFGATGNVYDMLTDVDMSLGKVKGEDGKMVELTHARYGSMLESPNRAVRKAAYERMMKAYAAYGSTFAATYAGNVKGDVFLGPGLTATRAPGKRPCIRTIFPSACMTTCSRPFTRRCRAARLLRHAQGSLQHSHGSHVRPVCAHDQGFPDEADL